MYILYLYQVFICIFYTTYSIYTRYPGRLLTLLLVRCTENNSYCSSKCFVHTRGVRL